MVHCSTVPLRYQIASEKNASKPMGYSRRAFSGLFLRPNFGFPKSGYEVRAISITPGSRDFETRESYGRRERNQPKRMSRRQSESGRDGESSRGEKLAKHWENKGQKREQADVLRRRPAAITKGQTMFDALNSVAGNTLPSNQRRDYSPHPSSTQDVGSESRKSTADFEVCPVSLWRVLGPAFGGYATP